MFPLVFQREVCPMQVTDTTIYKFPTVSSSALNVISDINFISPIRIVQVRIKSSGPGAKNFKWAYHQLNKKIPSLKIRFFFAN